MGRIGLAFLLGHCFVHSLERLPSTTPAAAALLAALALATSRWSKLAAALLLGIAWAWFNSATRLAVDLPTALEGEDLLIGGHIASLPQVSAGEVQFLFDVSGAAHGVPPRLRLTWYRTAPTLAAGDAWQLTVRLKRRNGLANFGGFDREGYLFREQIGAVGYVRDDERNRRLENTSACCGVLRMRELVASRVAEAAGGSRMLGILQGLSVGDAQHVSAAQWRIFSATGTTHLMAISGLHITMVATLAAWLGGAVVRWRRAQARAWNAMHGQVIAGAIAAISYSALAGMSVPTQRTLIMLCIWFMARSSRRDCSASHALGLALIAVLIIDPFAPFATGAWLSFGAVAVILLATSGRLQRAGPVANFTRVQIAVTIGLVPLLLAGFGGISLISPLANVLAVPLFTLLIVPSVLFGALAAVIHPALGTAVLAVPIAVLEGVWPVLEWFGNQPLAVWYLPSPSLAQLAALIVGALLLILPGIAATRLAGLVLCMPALLNHPGAPATGDFELTTLDVGQGLSVVVRTHSHVLVYDTGPAFGTELDAGVVAVVPFLRYRGVRALDALMVSHGDLDHGGGMRSIMAALPVRRLLTGPTVATRSGSLCRRGQSWEWDGVRFEILHPIDGLVASDNSTSCVLSIRSRAGSALISGDIEADAEAMLIAQGLEHFDVVVVPHHGSLTSSTLPFVEALRPGFALVSAGYRNRWGFPRSAALQRWRAVGARTFTTSDSGAIEIALAAGKAPQVHEYRRIRARYWRR
jgi:competence protein ComEC